MKAEQKFFVNGVEKELKDIPSEHLGLFLEQLKREIKLRQTVSLKERISN